MQSVLRAPPSQPPARKPDYTPTPPQAKHHADEAKQRSFRIMITLEESRACIAKMLNKLAFDPTQVAHKQPAMSNQPHLTFPSSLLQYRRRTRTSSRTPSTQQVDLPVATDGSVTVRVADLPKAIALVSSTPPTRCNHTHKPSGLAHTLVLALSLATHTHTYTCTHTAGRTLDNLHWPGGCHPGQGGGHGARGERRRARPSPCWRRAPYEHNDSQGDHLHRCSEWAHTPLQPLWYHHPASQPTPPPPCLFPKYSPPARPPLFAFALYQNTCLQRATSLAWPLQTAWPPRGPLCPCWQARLATECIAV